MTLKIPPPPSVNTDFNDFTWKDWFRILRDQLINTGIGAWSALNFSGSNITDIETRNHNDLQNVQGGGTSEKYHLTQSQLNGLVSGASTTLHTHPAGINFGQFYSTQTQSVSAINTPTRVTLNNTGIASNINLSSNKIYFPTAGKYNVAFSIQTTNSDTQIHDLDIWIRQGNGSGTATDLADTASVVSVASTHGGQPGYNVVAANFYINAAANDFIEFWWASNSTQVQLNYLPAITVPFTRPGAPSVIVTANYFSP